MPEPPEHPATEAPLDGVESLVATWLETPEPDRPARLEELAALHPGSAEELRARIAALEGLLADLPSPTDAVPARLGPFRLEERLGEGGMGVVHAAYDESLERRVALKLVRPELVWFPRTRERFRREVEAVARLQHPGIVPVYSVGEEGGLPWFAMELIQGRTLDDALARVAGRAPSALAGSDLFETRATWIDAVVGIAAQVARALQHAHDRGVLHRDVKPSNIALEHDGRARLLDFGLTALEDAESITQSGAHLGTLAYMAPEQVRGARVDARADVYGLGATLYELLTLAQPFPGPDARSIERAILAGPPPNPQVANPAIPNDVRFVVERALDPDPARRYATAGELAEDLERVLERRPVRAKPIGPLLRVRRFAQRRPALTAACLLGPFLLFGVPTLLWLQARAHGRELEDALLDETAARTSYEELAGLLLGAFESAEPELDTDAVPDAIDVLDEVSERTLALDAAGVRARLPFVSSMVRAYHALDASDRVVRLCDHAIPAVRGIDAREERTELAFLLLVGGQHRLASGDGVRGAAWIEEGARLAERLVAEDGATDLIERVQPLQVHALLRAHEGRAEEALALAERGLEQVTALGLDAAARGFAHVRVGHLASEAGELERACEELERGIELLREDERRNAAPLIGALDRLAGCRAVQGDLDAARSVRGESLELARRLWGVEDARTWRVRVGVARTLGAAGERAEAAGILLEAADWFELRRPSEVRTTAECLHLATEHLATLGLDAEAEPHLERLLRLLEAADVGEEPWEAFALGRLAGIREARGELESAVRLYERCGEAFAELRDRSDRGIDAVDVLGFGVDAALALGDRDAAGRMARRALEVLERDGLANPDYEPLFRRLANGE